VEGVGGVICQALGDGDDDDGGRDGCGAGRCRLTPGCLRVDSAWFQHLKLKYDERLSNFAFKFNLNHYSGAAGPGAAGARAQRIGENTFQVQGRAVQVQPMKSMLNAPGGTKLFETKI